MSAGGGAEEGRRGGEGQEGKRGKVTLHPHSSHPFTPLTPPRATGVPQQGSRRQKWEGEGNLLKKVSLLSGLSLWCYRTHSRCVCVWVCGYGCVGVCVCMCACMRTCGYDVQGSEPGLEAIKLLWLMAATN